MRLKQYIRGLGIGIIVTAVIIGISSYNHSANLSDEEIKAKAMELGMIEMVKDEAGEETKNETEELDAVVEENKEMESLSEEDPKEVSSVSEDVEEDIEETVDETLELDEYEEDVAVSSKEEEQNLVLLTIERGESSNTVASELERLQVIDNAIEFDEYLCDYDFSKKIRVGVYEISMDATYEEIANIICGME
jgi:hypothetical protein